MIASGSVNQDEPPLVSVVIPAHDSAATIVAAIESVAGQTFSDWELILCDDGSTDGTATLARERLGCLDPQRWRIVTLERSGPAEARNEAIRWARGEYVAFLDDDDTWEPEKLAKCVESLEAGPLDLICHDEWWVDEGGRARRRRYSLLYDSGLPPLVSVMRNNPFSTSAVVVRRALLREVGSFDPALPSAEDYDLWIRLAMMPGIQIGFLDEVLGTYSVRQGSESSGVDRRLRALLSIGSRYADPLREASRLGRLEVWMFRGKTYFTSGIRFAQQGRWLRGAGFIITGLLIWPLRLDWVRFAFRQRMAQRDGASS